MTFDLQIAARTVYGEARGEPDDGQLAVAHVIVNRLRTNRWGPTLANVCVAPFQFSSWNNNDPNRPLMMALMEDDPALTKPLRFLQDALVGAPDPTMGACWYYAVSLVPPPAWDQGQSFIQIGRHKFFAKDSA